MIRPHCVLAGAAATCLGIAGWLLAVDAPKTARIESLKNPGFEAGTDDWSIHDLCQDGIFRTDRPESPAVG